MAKPAKIVILGDASDAARAFKQIRDEAGKSESQLQKVGRRMESTGKGLTLGVTAPLLAAGAAATQAAEGLNESVNAVNKTFGDAADQIHDFGETSAEAVGLSARAFNDLAVPVGAMLRNAGLGVDEVAEKTINLAQRASDMASVFNVDVSEAMQAIQAGLRGEADPLERFGVNMKVSAVQAHAMAVGIADATGEMGPQEEALARISLLMEQTENIAGDFNETSGETANKARIEKARMEDLAAEIGQNLIPVKAQLLDVVSGVLDTFGEMSPATQGLIVKMGGLAAAVGPVLFVAGKLLTSMREIRSGMGSVADFIKGPWAGAVGIGVAAVVGFTAMLKENSDRVEFWKDALAEGSDAVDQLTDDMIVNEIVNRDLAGSMEEAGVNAADLKEAILGDSEAATEFFNKLGPGQEDLRRFAESQRIAREKAEEHRKALEDTESQLDDTGGAITGIISGGLQPYMRATDDARDSTDDLTGATKGLADEQRALVDPLFNLRRRTIDLMEAQQAYTDAVVEHGPKSQEAEDAAFELAEAQLDANAAAQRYADEGGPDSIAALEDLLREAGLAEQAIRDIIRSIDDLNAKTITPKFAPRQGGGVQDLPVFHEGGVVQGPRGSEQLVLAKAGETILPTHLPGHDLSAGRPVGENHLHVHVGTLYGVDDFDRFLQESLIRARRRGVAV